MPPNALPGRRPPPGQAGRGQTTDGTRLAQPRGSRPPAAVGGRRSPESFSVRGCRGVALAGEVREHPTPSCLPPPPGSARRDEPQPMARRRRQVQPRGPGGPFSATRACPRARSGAPRPRGGWHDDPVAGRVRGPAPGGDAALRRRGSSPATSGVLQVGSVKEMSSKNEQTIGSRTTSPRATTSPHPSGDRGAAARSGAGGCVDGGVGSGGKGGGGAVRSGDGATGGAVTGGGLSRLALPRCILGPLCSGLGLDCVQLAVGETGRWERPGLVEGGPRVRAPRSFGGRGERTAPLVELMGRGPPDVAFLESTELLPGKGGFCYDYSREGGTVVWPAQSR